MLTCIEMVPFSVFFHYAYTVKPYILPKSSHQGATQYIPLTKQPRSESQGEPMPEEPAIRSYQAGPLGVRAWIAVISPMEVLRGIAFAFKMAKELKGRPVM